MASYQDSLSSAYRTMGSQPIQARQNSTGGVDANVMGMEGYGDANYGWNSPRYQYGGGVADQLNKGSADYASSTVGKGEVVKGEKSPEYTGSGATTNKDSWWGKAYGDISKWAIKDEQVNPDRQAYQDAFKMTMAEKGYDYEMQSGFSKQLHGQERDLMTLSSDLGRRNTVDIMGAEHAFKTAGMETSQRLAKDYLGAETQADVRKTQEAGLQSRLGMAETGYQEREGMAEQGYQTRANTRVTGQESRLGTRVQGEENRAQTRTESDEQRRNMAFKNQQEVSTITSMGRR